MPELTRPQRELDARGPSGLGDLFGNTNGPGTVTVNHGPYCEQLPVADMTVGEVRRRFRSRFDIDPQSQAIVDGNVVADDTVVRQGQVLIFSRKAGEKGARSQGSGPPRPKGRGYTASRQAP